jgi:hypothetical protein
MEPNVRKIKITIVACRGLLIKDHKSIMAAFSPLLDCPDMHLVQEVITNLKDSLCSQVVVLALHCYAESVIKEYLVVAFHFTSDIGLYLLVVALPFTIITIASFIHFRGHYGVTFIEC